jgi:hypothetical protein
LSATFCLRSMRAFVLLIHMHPPHQHCALSLLAPDAELTPCPPPRARPSWPSPWP